MDASLSLASGIDRLMTSGTGASFLRVLGDLQLTAPVQGGGGGRRDAHAHGGAADVQGHVPASRVLFVGPDRLDGADRGHGATVTTDRESAHVAGAAAEVALERGDGAEERRRLLVR